MKALPFKIPKPEQDALVYQVDYGTSFYDKLHQHKEIQISLIVEGAGTLVVGDSVNDYAKNDVLIIGSNIPHVFKSDYSASNSFHMISLFFTRLENGLLSDSAFGAGFILDSLSEKFKTPTSPPSPCSNVSN